MAFTSVIGSSAVIRGNVRGDGSLEILGRVEGDVTVSGDIVLGSEGSVLGSVSGAKVVVGGSVEGGVTASESALIEATGRLVGDLAAPRIGMAEGALVRGNVRTEGDAGSASAPAAVAKAAPVVARATPPAHAPERAASPAPAPARRPAAPVRTKPVAKKASAKKPPPRWCELPVRGLEHARKSPESSSTQCGSCRGHGSQAGTLTGVGEGQRGRFSTHLSD